MIVRQQLLRILRQAIAAIAKGWIVVEIPDTRIKADALDDIARVEPTNLRIRVKLIEVRYAQRQIRIRKELDGFRFRRSREDHRDILLDRTFCQQIGKDMCPLRLFTDYDTRWMEIIIQRLALTQKLRREDDIVCMILCLHMFRVPDRHR